MNKKKHNYHINVHVTDNLLELVTDGVAVVVTRPHITMNISLLTTQMLPVTCMIKNHTIQGFCFQPKSYPCQVETSYSLKITDGSFYTHLIVHVVYVLPCLDVFEVGLSNEIMNITWPSSSNHFSY